MHGPSSHFPEAGSDEPVLIIHGNGLKGLKEPNVTLNAMNSGTTVRLLSGILAGQNFVATITGDESLQQRPMGRIIRPLNYMGVMCATIAGDEKLPMTIFGGNVHAIRYENHIASAQVKSCVLLAGLYADESTFYTEPVMSRNHTELMLGAFGGLPGQFSEIGGRMASGLEGGFSSIWSGVASAVKAKVGGLVESVKGLLGINSPSRVFSEIGENMAKGLESGWASGFVSAGRTVEEGMDFSARASRYGGGGSAAVNRIGFGDSALGRSSAAGIAAMANPALGRAGSEPVEINLILDGDRAASVLYDPLRRAAFRRGGEEILA